MKDELATFREQVAIVTGAGRGIGRSVSLALGRAGARVVLAARSGDQLEAVAGEIREAGGEAMPVPTDVSREEEVLPLFAAVKERFGRLDVLVNNAGAGAFGPLEEFTAADFDRVLSTNLRGTFLCAREALKIMKPRRSGTIINISSVVGFKGYPRQAAYTASKHGVMGLTKSLAAEAQEFGVRVSAVLPGGVDTELAAQARPDLHPEKLLQPEDIARTVMFLLSLPERAAIDEIYIRRRSSQPF
ncbi:MAG TPA: SDR family oxidoreductase [Candidatus Polarisedimenticolia bacterium]|jgi:NAD(P)-dependent dehydrogenase (short-subunit alcohol dehydrogenase family)|nr:SDR family oxidoreductase [Candidatus Polarisedimenticolia bacterium]